MIYLNYYVLYVEITTLLHGLQICWEANSCKVMGDVLYGVGESVHTAG